MWARRIDADAPDFLVRQLVASSALFALAEVAMSQRPGYIRNPHFMARGRKVDGCNEGIVVGKYLGGDERDQG